MAQTSAAKLPAARDTLFRWEGVDRKGHPVTGRSRARSESALRIELRRRGVATTRIRRHSGHNTRGGIRSGDIALFCRQLATLLAAGIPLVQGLEIIGAGRGKPTLQMLIGELKADVESGSTLHEALARHPQHFDELAVSLIKAGEQAGALDTLLDKLATHKERIEAIRKKVRKALFYPAAVLVVALIVSTILLIFAIPQFEELFSGLGADLPVFTRQIIDLSRFVQRQGWMLALITLSGSYALVHCKNRSRRMRQLLDRMALRMPVIGPILAKAAIARFAGTLSTLFSAGVPLVEALASVAGATGNMVYQAAVLKMRDEVATGQRLQNALENARLFPDMIVQMISVGEESGSLDTLSGKVARFYEEDVDNAVDNLASLLEPLIMVILSLLVGGLVIAMYLPIFKLGALV